MDETLRAFGVITARGGSKGLPGKNVADLGGRPVVAWSVAAALGSRELSSFILSSDDDDIRDAAQVAGCDAPFRRPAHLATDEASIIDVVFHALDWLGRDPEWTILLQASSPLRLAEDIDGCIRACIKAGGPAALSVSGSPKPPEWMFHLDKGGKLIPAVPATDASRRQLLAKAYVPNGAVYVANTAWLRESRSFLGPDTIAYIMPRERSVDIDEAMDLAMARSLVESGRIDAKL